MDSSKDILPQSQTTPKNRIRDDSNLTAGFSDLLAYFGPSTTQANKPPVAIPVASSADGLRKSVDETSYCTNKTDSKYSSHGYSSYGTGNQSFLSSRQGSFAESSDGSLRRFNALDCHIYRPGKLHPVVARAFHFESSLKHHQEILQITEVSTRRHIRGGYHIKTIQERQGIKVEQGPSKEAEKAELFNPFEALEKNGVECVETEVMDNGLPNAIFLKSARLYPSQETMESSMSLKKLLLQEEMSVTSVKSEKTENLSRKVSTKSNSIRPSSKVPSRTASIKTRNSDLVALESNTSSFCCTA
jgi:hypothetical protein